MGVNASREAQAIYGRVNTCTNLQLAPQRMKELKDARKPAPSPRDFMRSGLRERAAASSWEKPGGIMADGSSQTIECMNSPVGFPEAAPFFYGSEGYEPNSASAASSGYVAGDAMDGKGGYNALKLEDEGGQGGEEGEIQRGQTRGTCTAEMLEWHDNWLNSVELGELDIYTCLGLSNAFTFTADTRKVIAKVIGVVVLQVLVPIILLKVELDAGFSYKPLIPGVGFRTMGCCLYLYSLYSMYNNALDECRSSLLQWGIDQNIPPGQWLPLMFGELTNVFVSLILVLTLFVIFVDVEHPADLILNAVAVNFLGAVDGEFVDEDMKQDALTNFRQVFYEFGGEKEESDEAKDQHVMNIVLNAMLTFIVCSGLLLSMVFFFAPSPDHTETAHIGKAGYPKLI